MPHSTIDLTFLHDLRALATGRMVGFTASRESPDHHQRQRMRHQFGYLNLADGFVTGACVGGDEFIGSTLHDFYPAKRHVVIVPSDWTKVRPWWRGREGIEVIQMPAGTSYRDRNIKIVDMTTVLVGHPQYAEGDTRSRRSGSWQTVRLARRQHLISPFTLTLEDM